MIDSLKLELDGARDENIELEDRLEGSKGEVVAWKDEARKRKAEAGQLKDRVRRFDEDFHVARRCANFCTSRFDGRLSRAVGEAAEAAGEEMVSGVLIIKDEHGVIKDKYREAIADLTGVCNVLAKSSFQVFKKCAHWAGMEVKGSWDWRTVPWVMHEVTQAAEIMIVEHFLGSIGLLLMN